jgi:hypothetical protein
MNNLENRGKIISEIMGVKNCIQIYHWQTYGFSRHKASGEYYEKINDLLDQFVETMLNDGKRFTMPKKTFCTNMTDIKASEMLKYFAVYLKSLDFNKRPDLANIRDEILAETNKTLYLFSLQ